MRMHAHHPGRPGLRLLGIVALGILAVSATWGSVSLGPLGAADAAHGHKGATHSIDHIVVLMMENHAFDNYFGAYCPAVGANCPVAVQGFPSGLCVPLYPANASSPCVKPFPFTAANDSIHAPLPHDNASSHEAWDNGSMDGFYLAEHSGLTPFGYYNGTTIPLYWDIAQEFGLSDDFFSSTLSYSAPNHWYLLAGQAPAASFSTSLGSAYLHEANNTTSAEDLLLHHRSVSWNYYDYALPSWQQAKSTTGSMSPGAFNYWNPQAAKYESYSRTLAPHFVPNTQFFSDAAAGKLPDLSWVIPFFKESDHPPGNVTVAQSWVASVVDAVEQSPEWNSTALFISWDDYGGFYDGAPPPTVDGIPLSFRVPLLVVSPYTSAGMVSHSQGYFESLLHYMETQFGLGCITSRDCNAPLPTAFFNLSASPRAPVLFPTNPADWSYPYVAPTDPTAATQVPTHFTSDPTGDGVDVD
jgi:phospholipase C